MNSETVKQEIIRYWLNKAHEALASAESEQDAGRFSFAINRAYYACFYSLSAVLIKMGHRFKKHTGVRASFQKIIIGKGLVDHEWGRFYKWIFENRQRGDYQDLTEFTHEETMQAVFQAKEFVMLMEKLLENPKVKGITEQVVK